MYQIIINTAGKSFPVVTWPWFCKWKTLGLPIWRLELTISKIKLNYLKYRDLAPLIWNWNFYRIVEEKFFVPVGVFYKQIEVIALVILKKLIPRYILDK